MQLKEREKEQSKPKVSRRKEIKIRSKWNREQKIIEKINEARSCFKETSKGKPLARWARRLKLLKSEMEVGQYCIFYRNKKNDKIVKWGTVHQLIR